MGRENEQAFRQDVVGAQLGKRCREVIDLAEDGGDEPVDFFGHRGSFPVAVAARTIANAGLHEDSLAQSAPLSVSPAASCSSARRSLMTTRELCTRSIIPLWRSLVKVRLTV